MSFFKELKEDIVQSVNELGDTLEEQVTDTEKNSEKDEELKNERQKKQKKRKK